MIVTQSFIGLDAHVIVDMVLEDIGFVSSEELFMIHHPSFRKEIEIIPFVNFDLHHREGPDNGKIIREV